MGTIIRRNHNLKFKFNAPIYKKGSILKLESQTAQSQGGGAHGLNYPMGLSVSQRRNLELAVPVWNSQGEALGSMGEKDISFPHNRVLQGYMWACASGDWF